MKVDVRYNPSYSLDFISLDGGEEVRVEGGSLVSMSDGVIIETEATGGFLSSISRKMFGGESFFQNTFQAPSGGGLLRGALLGAAGGAAAGKFVDLGLEDDFL